MIEIRRYVSGLLASNMYVVVEGDHAVVIDPFEDTSPGAGLTVDHILLTHEHYDHISGVNVWKKEYGCPVLCSSLCAENIRDPRKNLAYYFKEFCELQTWKTLDAVPPYDPGYSCAADEVFDDRIAFEWYGHEWNLFELPGHSLGSIGIVLDARIFFSGDSLINHYKTAFNIPGGSRKKWLSVSVPRLEAIPKGTYVYPGHFDGFIYSEDAL